MAFVYLYGLPVRTTWVVSDLLCSTIVLDRNHSHVTTCLYAYLKWSASIKVLSRPTHRTKSLPAFRYPLALPHPPKNNVMTSKPFKPPLFLSKANRNVPVHEDPQPPPLKRRRLSPEGDTDEVQSIPASPPSTPYQAKPPSVRQILHSIDRPVSIGHTDGVAGSTDKNYYNVLWYFNPLAAHYLL